MGTVLGKLAASIGALAPGKVLANASRCPDLVRRTIEEATGTECGILFESRPLGACRTVAGLAGLARGTWFVVNTDMVTDADPGAMLSAHRDSGSDWTVLAGPPLEGYGRLEADGHGSFGSGRAGMHYWGIGIMEPAVFRLASRMPGAGMFDGLAKASSDAGMRLGVYEAGPGASWIDTGSVESYRAGLLSEGSHVHPEAVVEDATSLSGRWFVGRGCRVRSGTRLADSVMLDGSELAGGELVSTVLPWDEVRGTSPPGAGME